MARGLFIVFEGVDRSGKSTLSRLITSNFSSILAGKKASYMRFPDRETPIGKELDRYLSQTQEKPLPSEAIHLLFSANRWEKQKNIEELLLSGESVIADRYAFSGIAYSGGALGLDFHWCRWPDVGLIEPDVVFFLDLPPEEAAKRGSYGEEVYERLETQTAVRAAYASFAIEKFWWPLDATKDVESLKAEVSARLTEISASSVTDGPLRRLWAHLKTKNDATVAS